MPVPSTLLVGDRIDPGKSETTRGRCDLVEIQFRVCLG